MRSVLQQLNIRLIQPRSLSPDEQRREYIFNVIIAFFTAAAALATISSGLTHLLGANAHNTNSVPTTILFLLVMSCLWWLSRRGRYKIGAYLLVIMTWLAAFQLSLAWSFELPMAQILNVLVIIVAGIALSSRLALVIALLTSCITLVLARAQVAGAIPVDVSWLTKRLEFSDAVGIVVVYAIVGAITWLANNEIDSLLKRAWRSEKALAKERDQLEVTVARRTRELEMAQLERTRELQHFAEYGRISASLVHDLASPLTAASLNLEQVSEKQSSLVKQAMASLRAIEHYIEATRRQLQGGGQTTTFAVSDHIKDVVVLLRNQARKIGIQIKVSGSDQDTISGDPAMFDRVIANLVTNAIQAYPDKVSNKKAVVSIKIVRQDDQLQISVHDQGRGIPAADLPQIFDELYSTKKHTARGLGLGLATAKDVIEKQFKGTISVESRPRVGTTFIITIPQHATQDTKKS